MRTFFGMLLVACVAALAPVSALGQASGSVPGRPLLSPAQTVPPPRAFDDPLAPAGWKRYELQFNTGNVMSVFLPSLSEVDVNQHPMGPGRYATSYTYTASTSSDAYAVSYLAGLPAEMTDNAQTRATLFEGFWRGFAGGLRRALERTGITADLVTQPPRKKMVGGFEVQEQDFSIGTMQGTARAVFTGGYGYAVVVVSVKGEPGDEHKSFLNSFKLRARR